MTSLGELIKNDGRLIVDEIYISQIRMKTIPL